MTDSLEHIIKDCVAGKNAARERLYQKFSAKMWALCLRYANDRDTAKDFLQEGFIKVFDKISQYKGIGNFEGWMRKIFINIALAEFRKKRNLSIDAVITHEELHETYENIECEISAEELLDLVKSLPPHYRMAFNLYAIEGYSHKDIGEMLGISEGTSKSNVSRAREILQRKLNVIQKSEVKIG